MLLDFFDPRIYIPTNIYIPLLYYCDWSVLIPIGRHPHSLLATNLHDYVSKTQHLELQMAEFDSPHPILLNHCSDLYAY
jgi:hypothetical protein